MEVIYKTFQIFVSPVPKDMTPSYDIHVHMNEHYADKTLPNKTKTNKSLNIYKEWNHISNACDQPRDSVFLHQTASLENTPICDVLK